MQEIALFSGKIYTPGTNFTRLSVVTVTTILNSDEEKGHFGQNNYTLRKLIVIENDDW